MSRIRFLRFLAAVAVVCLSISAAPAAEIARAFAAVDADVIPGGILPNLRAAGAFSEAAPAPHFTYTFECIGDCGGTGGWTETVHNLVVTAGKNDLIDKYFKGSAYTATWYMGLKGTGSVAAGDTLASHVGWSEVTPYAGNRPAITFGTSSGGSNTATAVSYSINATATVAGAFVASVSTGTAGTLYSASDFAASRSVVSGDTLNVTLTVSF